MIKTLFYSTKLFYCQMAILTSAHIGHFAQLNVWQAGCPILGQRDSSLGLVKTLPRNHFDAFNDGANCEKKGLL